MGRDSAIHMHVAILSQTPFLSKLPHNIEAGPCPTSFFKRTLKSSKHGKVHLLLYVEHLLWKATRFQQCIQSKRNLVGPAVIAACLMPWIFQVWFTTDVTEKTIKTMNFLCVTFNHEHLRSYLEEIGSQVWRFTELPSPIKDFWNQRPQIQFVRPPVIHKIIFPYGYDKTSEHIELETSGDKQSSVDLFKERQTPWHLDGQMGTGNPLFPLLNCLGFNTFLYCKEVCNRFGGERGHTCVMVPFPGCRGCRGEFTPQEPKSLGTRRRQSLPQARYAESGSVSQNDQSNIAGAGASLQIGHALGRCQEWLIVRISCIPVGCRVPRRV